MLKFLFVFSVSIQLFLFSSVAKEIKSYSSSSKSWSNPVYNVIDFGAKGDGAALDTKAVQEAIDSCSITGGCVLFPAGKFLIGSIVLKNNVKIYLSEGSTILGSTDLKNYQPHRPHIKSYNDSFLRYSLFYGENLNNVSIEGEGTIDGQGSAFKVTTKKKPDRYKNRPFVFRFIKCRNIRIEGITMRNSAMWMQHYLGCDHLVIKGITVFNHANQNNDMMDIDGCSNVLITGCFGDTDDDGITLKSTSPLIDRNIIISNCIVSSHNNAVKIGTESTGGFENITISNIVIKPSSVKSIIFGEPNGICGIALETVDGGVMDGVNVSDITMDSVEVPLFIRLGNRARKYTANAPVPGVGSIKNVSISNIVATNVGSTGCSITGITGYDLENISLSNIRILFDGGGTSEDASKKIPELSKHYPESTMWGKLPAYGFFIRHADKVSLNNIRLNYNGVDKRPAIVCDDIENSSLSKITALCDSNAVALMKFQNVRNTEISSSRALSNKIRRFLDIEGENNSKIKLIGNDFTNAVNILGGTNLNAVTLINNVEQ